MLIEEQLAALTMLTRSRHQLIRDAQEHCYSRADRYYRADRYQEGDAYMNAADNLIHPTERTNH